MSKELTGRRLLLAQEYIKNGFNGRKAWKTIYGDCSDEVADASQSRALSSVKVKTYLKDKMKPIEANITSQVETYSELIDGALEELKTCRETNMPIPQVIALLEKLSKPIRTMGEFRGKIGSGHNTAVQVNVATPALFDAYMKGDHSVGIGEKEKGYLDELKTITVKTIEA